MSKIKVYAKSAVDLHSKLGVYAFICDDMVAQLDQCKAFRISVKTLTQADCMAYVNALGVLAKTQAALEVEELEIITDSGKVAELLEIYKAEKHCEEAARYWREHIKPIFKMLQRLKITKISSKVLSGDSNSFNITKCFARAQGELARLKEITQ